MKKQIFSLLLAFCITGLYSQNVILSENFDSFSAGTPLAQQSLQADSSWTTWDNLPGGPKDPNVSNSKSYSSPNSVYISGGKDLVLLLDNKTSGRYQLKFKIMIESGKLGYFNILQDFNGSNSKWAMQAFFHPGGIGSVDAGGDSTGTFSFNYNQWISVKAIMDLDDDFATLYIDGQEVVSWKYSTGATGGDTIQTLDGANFYGWTGSGGTPGYYIDNVEFSQRTAPDSVINLQATTSGKDIDLTWNNLSGNQPDAYSVMRNGDIIDYGIKNTNYTDNNPYPNTYTYRVRAHYANQGYSHVSDSAMATATGGVSRELVVFEIGSFMFDSQCYGSAEGADSLRDAGHNVAIIDYHKNDSYETNETQNRLGFYKVSAFPTTIADGKLKLDSGSATQSLYPAYKQFYDQRMSKPSIYTINQNLVQTGYDIQARVSITQETSHLSGSFTLHNVLTESHIPEQWVNQNEMNFVCREMFPDASGQTIDFSSQTTYKDTVYFTFDTSYVHDNCQFITFLQHDSTKEIVQAAKFDISTISGINKKQTAQLKVYPNPARKHLKIENLSEKGNFIIHDIFGNQVLSGNISTTNSRLDISHLASGVYFISVKAGENIHREKFIKQ